jgi:hypothetical protein
MITGICPAVRVEQAAAPAAMTTVTITAPMRTNRGTPSS